jgi:hypothetical protein
LENIVNKTKYQIDIICESDDYEFIENKEREFIKLYGRRDLKEGSLVNMTDGGKGQMKAINRNTPMKLKRKCQILQKEGFFLKNIKKNLDKLN